MDPLDSAKNGVAAFFKEVATSDDLLITDEDGDSLLSVAAKANHLACCQEIYTRCPSLLYHQSNVHRYTVLHHAGWRGNPEIIQFLIDAAARTPFHDIENGEGQNVYDDKKLFRMLDGYGDSGLYKSVENNKYEAAKLLINADPDFDYGVNRARGETMLMAALRLSYGKTDDESGVKIRRLLLEKLPNSSKVRVGDKEWTALHHATHNGDLCAIQDILGFCPECLELVDSDGRNFLHLAAKYGHVKVVKYVLESGYTSLLNVQDKDGNTPLHIAALGDDETQAHCAVCLRYDSRVNKLTVNNKGQKVSGALKAQARDYDVIDGVNKKKLKDRSDIELLVCALIATLSFTVGITVPGGYISDGVNHGMATLAKKTTFQVFMVFNTLALTLSFYAMFSHFSTRYLHRKEDVDFQVTLATYCTTGAIFALVIAFPFGSYAVLAIINWLAIYVFVNCGVFFFFAFWAIWRIIRQ